MRVTTITVCILAAGAVASMTSVRAQDVPSAEKCREVCAAALKTQLSDSDKKILAACSANKRCSLTPSTDGPGSNPLIRLNPRS